MTYYAYAVAADGDAGRKTNYGETEGIMKAFARVNDDKKQIFGRSTKDSRTKESKAAVK